MISSASRPGSSTGRSAPRLARVVGAEGEGLAVADRDDVGAAGREVRVLAHAAVLRDTSPPEVSAQNFLNLLTKIKRFRQYWQRFLSFQQVL